jgi:alkyldihydroxyacetonephosphate synthase
MFPDAESRQAMAARLGAALGIEPPLPRVLPSLESARMPEPRFAPPLELRGIGTTDRRARASHTYGRGYRDLVRGFAGDFAAAPDWVFYPTEEEHLRALFRFCERDSIALVPFGGGTSVVGGVEHVAGGRFRGTASVDLTRMNKVLEVDSVSRAARIQAGASGPEIAEQLNPFGLAFRHYPQSFELSTLGGWLATRASGHFATLYTRIDDVVESVRMLTPSGVFETRRLPASGAGPGPERFVLGSEGAFGIITEAWVRVQSRPRWRASASVQFRRFEDGVLAARTLAQSGLFPSNCRLLDPAEAMLHQVTSSGASVLLLGFESSDHPVEPWMERALSIATDLGGTDDEPKYTTDIYNSVSPRASAVPPPPPSANHPVPKIDHETDNVAHWKQSFLGAPYLQSALVSLGVVCDTFETACTWDRFGALHQAVTAAVGAAMQEACGGGLLTCRFTHVYPDGPAPYFTFVAPGRPGAELEQWSKIKAAASDALLANGGTITHHHAVGRVHRAWYDQERAPLLEAVLVAAKERLDPSGILNPGCLLPSKP